MRDSSIELQKDAAMSSIDGRASDTATRRGGCCSSCTSLESRRTDPSAEWPLHPGEIKTINQFESLPLGIEALDFLLLRDQTHSVQGVLACCAANADLVRWVRRIGPESLIQVCSILKESSQPVRSATHSGVEVDICSVHHVNPAQNLPFCNYKPPETLRNRMSSHILDLRYPFNQALIRVQSLVTHIFRETLENHDFVEIHTPKLQPAATESGAAVFLVNYFGRKAFLAQSPQLAKQMAINADYPEVIQLIDIFLKEVFKAVYSSRELDVIRKRWPSGELKWLDETLVIPFSDGIKMLREDGRDVEEEDLSTPDEIRLGQLVREKYGTDYYVLDKFPAGARPFYTAKDPDDPKYTRSFDIFIRG
ncbi:Aspartate--tRNA ligase [Fusarium oxysporum f. sp. rapae]|uniref:Aspartate--tRNA ligase n=1 Tax=Fusarium oxysporum f. sp. rapae TaxID=485398 RepID=A0A8J5NKZ5_FUSOX|nr:Aspartate--tRNA ligase [Fusarium oxysporum f. sp. rapae]